MTAKRRPPPKRIAPTPDVLTVKRELESLKREQALALSMLRSLQTEISSICTGLQTLKEQVGSCVS